MTLSRVHVWKDMPDDIPEAHLEFARCPAVFLPWVQKEVAAGTLRDSTGRLNASKVHIQWCSKCGAMVLLPKGKRIQGGACAGLFGDRSYLNLQEAD